MKQGKFETKEFYSAEEVGERLGAHRNTVLAWIRSGKLKGSKIGHRTVRVSHADLLSFYEKHKAEKPEENGAKPQ